MNEERFNLLRRLVLRARQQHTAVVRLMVDKVDQISINEAILQLHWVLRPEKMTTPILSIAELALLSCCGNALCVWLSSRHDTHAMSFFVVSLIPDVGSRAIYSIISNAK